MYDVFIRITSVLVRQSYTVLVINTKPINEHNLVFHIFILNFNRWPTENRANMVGELGGLRPRWEPKREVRLIRRRFFKAPLPFCWKRINQSGWMEKVPRENIMLTVQQRVCSRVVPGSRRVRKMAVLTSSRSYRTWDETLNCDRG